jgi:hypothetical protein
VVLGACSPPIIIHHSPSISEPTDFRIPSQTYNSLGQSPCAVAAYLQSVCGNRSAANDLPISFSFRKAHQYHQNSFYNSNVDLKRHLLHWADWSIGRERLVQVQHGRLLAHERLRCLPRFQMVLVRSPLSFPFLVSSRLLITTMERFAGGIPGSRTAPPSMLHRRLSKPAPLVSPFVLRC